jgi:hypothetical protein
VGIVWFSQEPWMLVEPLKILSSELQMQAYVKKLLKQQSATETFWDMGTGSGAGPAGGVLLHRAVPRPRDCG